MSGQNHSNCGCVPKSSNVRPKEFVVPDGYKLPVEGCVNGVPIPVRSVGGNVMTGTGVGCINPGEPARILFADNPQRSAVKVSNSPTSQGVLSVQGNASATPSGLVVLPGQTETFEYTGPVYVVATSGQVTYSAVEITFA